MSSKALIAKARQVVNSLADRPGLMFEVLRIVADEYDVAGPWENHNVLHLRKGPTGETLAKVFPEDSKGNWRWQFLPDDLTGAQETGVEASVDLAKTELELRLREGGWVLA